MKTTNRFRIGAMIFCVSVMALAFLPRAKADEWNRKTRVSFSAPVEVPGVGAQVLPAGTYVFKIVDSASDRHIVQIFNESEDHVYTTILAIPNYRLKTTDKTVMTFKERAEGQPEAIRAWFYPGRQWGEEFVYPKSRAIELAKVVNQPVLAMPLDAEPTVEVLKAVQVEAVKPTGEEVPVAEVVEAPPVETAAAAPAEDPLPHTASTLPLVGLMGLLSLGAGLAFSVISRRSA
jgi:hypothetical protein